MLSIKIIFSILIMTAWIYPGIVNVSIIVFLQLEFQAPYC